MKKDIRNLLMVLGVAVLGAFALTGWFLYTYSPSGQYEAQNVLLEPSLLARLNYNDTNPKINQTDRYQFDKLAYFFWDKNRQEWGTLQVDLPTYEKFYKMIKGDDSLKEPPREITTLFTRTPPAYLALKVKTESSEKWQADVKDFQRVEFAENSDYYRISLHEDKSGANWSYFYHPKIYQATYRLFIP